MPRVTRAALRSQEAHEDLEFVSLPAPVKSRVPLGETTGNSMIEVETINIGGDDMAATKKSLGKVQKGNAAKKPTKSNTTRGGDNSVEVLEDDNQSQTSSAADLASKDLIREPTDTDILCTDDGRPRTPPSAAVNEATQQVSPRPATPESNQFGRHQSDTTSTPNLGIESMDPNVVRNEPQASSNVVDKHDLDTGTMMNAHGEDSFVEKIKNRTPAKHVSRIEDSVEALDALEEELEKVDGLIPESTDIQSPAKPKAHRKSSCEEEVKQTGTSVRTENNANSGPKSDGKGSTLSDGSRRPRDSLEKHRINSSGPSGGSVNPKPSAKVQKPTTNSSAAVKSAQKIHKRISSIHKTPFQPAKSTKPPTRTTFELPGEAVSRKLKEQREERMKREEEEKSKPHVFKARPVRRSEAPEVKLTAAARARLSIAKGETVNPVAKPQVSKPRVSACPPPLAPAGINKRHSSLSIQKRSDNPSATTTGPRGPRSSSISAPAHTRKVSISGEVRPAPTAEDLAHQKVKGKEVFGRAKADIQEREKAKKEKEEAAKRARAEAAERGRVASRAWAEQQKLKKIKAEKAKNISKPVEA